MYQKKILKEAPLSADLNCKTKLQSFLLSSKSTFFNFFFIFQCFNIKFPSFNFSLVYFIAQRVKNLCKAALIMEPFMKKKKLRI